MQCEVCGREIAGEPYRVIIERAKMTTCAKCAELGSNHWEPESFKHTARGGSQGTVRSVPIKRKSSTSVPEDLGVVENFGLLARQAREKLGLSHDDLGKKIGERVSVIRKVESGKMMPDQKLAAKLEHTLRVKLLTPIAEPKTLARSSPPAKHVTLGEIVILKNGRRRRRPENEGDHSQS